jgi:hypothetical protein
MRRALAAHSGANRDYRMSAYDKARLSQPNFNHSCGGTLQIRPLR